MSASEVIIDAAAALVNAVARMDANASAAASVYETGGIFAV